MTFFDTLPARTQGSAACAPAGWGKPTPPPTYSIRGIFRNAYRLLKEARMNRIATVSAKITHARKDELNDEARAAGIPLSSLIAQKLERPATPPK